MLHKSPLLQNFMIVSSTFFQPTLTTQSHVFQVFLTAVTAFINTNPCIGLLLLQKCCTTNNYEVSVVCSNKRLFSSHVWIGWGSADLGWGSSAGWLCTMCLSSSFWNLWTNLRMFFSWQQQNARAQDLPCKSISRLCWIMPANIPLTKANHILNSKSRGGEVFPAYSEAKDNHMAKFSINGVGKIYLFHRSE